MNNVFIDPVIADVRKLYASAQDPNNPTLVIRELLSLHADVIYTAFLNGESCVKFHLGSWCPDVVGKKPEQIEKLDIVLTQVRESVAREYGFSSWQAVLELEDKQLDSEFEQAVENVTTGRVDALQAQLTLNTSLTTQCSTFGHGSTLLHYLGANGVESQRQITPMNCVEVAQCLIEHGADVNAYANMYGGGSTTLGLVLTSAHPANAGVTEALAKVLQEAGGKES